MSDEAYHARQRANDLENRVREMRRKIPSAESMGVTFGPPVGEGWESFVQWRRQFVCACGYMGLEYWNGAPPLPTVLVCLKCGMGRRAEQELKP